MAYRLSRPPPWMLLTSSFLSKEYSQVRSNGCYGVMCCISKPRHFFFSEIYRIVSNKALETSNNAIKPTGGQTILVSQSPDDQKPAGGCC